MRISDWSSDVCSSDLAKAESPANRFAGLLRIPSFSAASVAGAAHQAEEEHEHVDEVEIEVQRPHHDRFAHKVGAADVEIHALDLLRVIGGEAREHEQDRKSTRLNSSH